MAAGNHWYFVAYDLHKEAWRTFRVDRLTGPAATGHRVPARELPAPDAAAYVAATIATAPARHTAQATVPEPAETVRARTGALPQRVRPVDDKHCTVDLAADDPRHIAVQLLLLGPQAAVRGTPQLAPHLR
ncbi:helix-turn-helix transcriptional regulator [Streptomyces monticola]|uniref:Helix-turn-helix transcriptional regulator n=1 Tax=Streptomyces monticola TaxID=2666263 RepID=A0ABW2JDG7_9ACTN